MNHHALLHSLVRLSTARVLPAIIVVAATLYSQAGAVGDDWPAFRGPRGNGTTSEKSVPLRWSATDNITWKVKLPRAGNGSPIVADGSVFVTSAEDAEGKQRSLYCFDSVSGKTKWVRTVLLDTKMPTHQTNPYCGSTPAFSAGKVVVWHATGGLYCYRADGTELWSRKFGEFRHLWGYGTSPIIYQNRVIMHCGPGQSVFMIALDLENGKTIWKTDEPIEGNGQRNTNNKYMGSWSTPVVAKIDGRDQIVCSMPTRVNGYDPRTGAIVWSCQGLRGPKGDLAYSSPMISGETCVVIGGFGGPGMGFRLGGTGDITKSSRLWRNEKNPQSIGTGVFLGKHVYRANAARPAVQCINPQTGEVIWGAPNRMGSAWGSIVAAADRLYLTNQQGMTMVFKADPEKFELLSTNDLKEPSNATPAIAHGRIFIRTFDHLYCVGGSKN